MNKPKVLAAMKESSLESINFAVDEVQEAVTKIADFVIDYTLPVLDNEQEWEIENSLLARFQNLFA